MGKYGEPLPDFYEERTRILEVLKREENRDIIMRLIGALAFRTHCPKFGYLQDELGREFSDIDFASYRRFYSRIIELFKELGYREDLQVSRLFGAERLLFHDDAHRRHVDVFFDKLEFSQVIPLEGRLEAEDVTLPLAELLLTKMQIIELNEKDLIDTIMLLREHPIGETDNETINALIIAKLCAKDWGLWRTVTANLDVVDQFLDRYPQLSTEDRTVVSNRIHGLQDYIKREPKTLTWKLRNKIGDRVKWYKNVEELTYR